MKMDISSDWLSSGSGGGKSSFEFESNDKGLLNTLESKEELKVEDKTVEFDGMVYEIGKLYEFSDPSDYSYLNIETLTSIDVNDDFPFKTDKSSYWYCRAVTGEAGTITPALVKLIDGDAYMFECQGDTRLGFKFGEYMRIDKYTKFSIDRCSNITRLVPEVK